MSILCYAFFIESGTIARHQQKNQRPFARFFFSVDVVHIDDEMMHTACVDCS